MRAAGAGRLWVAGALLAALAACGKTESLKVGDVRVSTLLDPTTLGEAGLDARTLEAAARSALADAGFHMAAGPRAQVAAIGVESVRVVPGAPGPSAEVKVEMALFQPDEAAAPNRREAGVGIAPLLGSAPSPHDGWRRALSEATQRAAEGLAIGARADGKTEEGLIADLTARDLRVREQAARVLGERRSRAAVPTMLSRLRTEDSGVAMRMIGALAQIGDERAVPALIDLARGTDSIATARLVHYIGDIGGSEAEGFLLTLESGHEDLRVREAARDALADLAARARPSDKMPSP